MIYIVPKPTDTPDDNSTDAVVRELARAGIPFKYLNLDAVDPFSSDLEDSLIWVCGLKQDEHQFETLQALSISNRIVNSPTAIYTCASKVLTTALLIKHEITTPETLFTASKEIATDFLLKHKKMVTKPVYGFDGNGIHLIESPDRIGNPPYYLQEYVPNKRDYRVFVIDGEPIGAIMRESDTLTHNIHQGGRGTPCTIDNEMRDIAIRAASAIRVDYAGVDLLDYNGTYCVLEVNGTPNWHCIAAPIPRLIAEYLIEKS